MAVSGARLAARHARSRGGWGGERRGAIVKYLSLAFVLALAVAPGYQAPFWPFLAAGLITDGAGFVLERVTRGTAIGPREGF